MRNYYLFPVCENPHLLRLQRPITPSKIRTTEGRPGKRSLGASTKFASIQDMAMQIASPSKSNTHPMVSIREIVKTFPGVVANDRIDFDIYRSEIHALLGENGAGKSTLLKILSKITEPTKGRIELRGRIGSLLEVGTGFHPELTGDDRIHRG